MLAIRAGQLIDGLGGSPIKNAVVLVEGEKIARVGPVAEVEIPPHAAVYDASGKTVIPGLIDAHVHVHTQGGPVANYALAEGRLTQGSIALRAYSYTMQALRMGYTAMRSLNSPGYVDVALRDAINEGIVKGPRLRACG
jgi:imidazolonepropionase-like amidohydrolase